MKSLKVLSLLCVCFLVCTLILKPCVTYASPYDLMIGTDSNAIMTLNLDDSDYAVMPMSSIGTVTNTVMSGVRAFYSVYNPSDNSTKYISRTAELVDGRYRFSYEASEGCVIKTFTVRILEEGLPSPGTYDFSLDLSSDFSYDYTNARVYARSSFTNAEDINVSFDIPFSQYSGDLYISPYTINVSNLSYFDLDLHLNTSDNVNRCAGSFSINFKRVSSDSSAPSTGPDLTTQDYENNVSSSLSDLSSSVESVEEEISLVTQAIQTLQGAMEPHYDNVLTQLHHITEQLHAFYDQVYNNIHLPELDMLTQIRTAIENIDLQIEVDISEVKTAINNMSTAVQNKLQSTTDQITGGFDNSQQTQQNQQLHDSINAYDEVEEDIFEDVDGFMQEFEYPSFDSMNGSVIKALAFIGGFLQRIFLSMGDFGTIITFSLTMIFVMIIVGYHRIRS